MFKFGLIFLKYFFEIILNFVLLKTYLKFYFSRSTETLICALIEKQFNTELENRRDRLDHESTTKARETNEYFLMFSVGRI